ncbi:ATP-binding protein [Desulfoplanes sp.]
MKEVVRSFPVLVLVGPRQVGKTSILERTFPGYRYVSLDVAQNAESAETRPREFLGLNPPAVIIDEIQYAPSFFRHIKTWVDAHKNQNGLFILTGSRNFMLMEAVSDSLAGRAAVVPFFGVSAGEWEKSAVAPNVSIREFIWKGAFPALWAGEPMPGRERWYQGYVATYLERDVRNILRIGSLRDFERFLRACAARIAQTLNVSELGRDVGISTTTARQWLSVLQASNQIVLLEPYYRSLGKRLVKSPKLYFTDTGLAAYLAGFQDAATLFASPSAGAYWENHVLNQWFKWRDWHRPSAALWYWRDQAGNEVDLLVEMNRKLYPVETKLKEHPTSKDTRGIDKMVKMYGAEDIGACYIACSTQTPFDVKPGVTAVNGRNVWELA